MCPTTTSYPCQATGALLLPEVHRPCTDPQLPKASLLKLPGTPGSVAQTTHPPRHTCCSTAPPLFPTHSSSRTLALQSCHWMTPACECACTCASERADVRVAICATSAEAVPPPPTALDGNPLTHPLPVPTPSQSSYSPSTRTPTSISPQLGMASTHRAPHLRRSYSCSHRPPAHPHTPPQQFHGRPAWWILGHAGWLA